jgi:CHAT domain-containing protein
VASASELDACARVWKGDHVLLKGAAASRLELAAQLQREPAVVHFATHFLEFPGEQADSAIALGLTAAKEIDLLTPEEIAHRTVRAGLVVLSGCHSAAGAVLPGTGLLGLTRAFLAAGAGAVVSSRWSTPDDDGALFAALYANLGAQAPANAGRALRAAQLSMIRSGGRRARPRYWSAYFLVGNL